MKRHHEGWTLIELLVVLIILSVMLGLVAWRVSAWRASQQAQGFQRLSDAWLAMLHTVSDQNLSVRCQLFDAGWACSSWSVDISGKTGWLPLHAFPWQSKAIWPKFWHWREADAFNMHADARHDPDELMLCHQNRCWAVLSAKWVTL